MLGACGAALVLTAPPANQARAAASLLSRSNWVLATALPASQDVPADWGYSLTGRLRRAVSPSTVPPAALPNTSRAAVYSPAGCGNIPKILDHSSADLAAYVQIDRDVQVFGQDAPLDAAASASGRQPLAPRLAALSDQELAARVGPRQFADLDALLDECVDVLDASAKPELYVMQSPIADAFTIGMGKPFTVITSGLYDLVTHDEMRFVMGHELGHALSGHAVYRTMMMHLLRLARSFGVLPVGGWALRAIVAALLEWQRKSELSGDRAGLLCAQDLDTALRVEMKLAGGCRLDKLDSEAFLAQAREYETSGDMRDGVLKLLNLELQTHPFSVLRAAALTHWVDTGGYAKVIAGEYPRRADDGNAKFADDLGAAARYYRDGFDQSNDPLIKGIRDGFGGIVEGVGRAASNAADSLGRKITEWRQPSK